MWLQEFIVGLIVAGCLFYIGRIVRQKVNYIRNADSFENNRNCIDCPLMESCKDRKKRVAREKKHKNACELRK